MLSQIELGRSVPTITVLSRIAAAFEIPAAAFLSAEKTGRGTILKRNDADVLKSPDGKFVSRALFPFDQARRVEFYELTISPGGEYTSDAHRTGTSENLVVTSGALEVETGADRYALSCGDALHFIADRPHTYRNLGADLAVGYLVMTYLQPVRY